MANRITVILEALGFDKGANEVKGFRQSIADADGVTNKFKAGASSAMSTVSAHAGALALTGGAALVGFGVKAVGAFTDTAKAAIDAGAATGLAVEDASRWIAVGDDFGLTAEQLASGVGKITKSLDSGKWEQYGVATRDAGGAARSTNDILIDSLAMLSDIDNETERARVGAELFGKGYANLAPIIGHTADEYRNMLGAVEEGQVITKKEAERAEKMRLAQDKLADAMEEVTLAAGEMAAGLAPTIEKLAEFVELTSKLPDIKLPLTDVTPFQGSIGFLTDMVGELRDTLNETETSGGGGFRGTAEEAAALTAELEKAEQAAAKLRAEAEERLTTASDKLAQAFGGAAAEAQGLKDVMSDAESEARDLADAELDNKRAADGVAEATRRAEQATKDYDAAMDALTGDIEDEQAFLGLADQFDDLKVKAAEAYTAAAEGADDADEKARDFRQGLLDLNASTIDYLANVLKLPPEKITEVKALIDQGKLDEANWIIAELTRTRTLRIEAQIFGTQDVGGARYGGPRAAGGPTQPGMFYKVGEGGNPELYQEGGDTYLIPGSNGKVTPAGAGGGMGRSGATYTINVNAGIGANGAAIGQEVVKAIKQYELANGSGWRN